MNERREGRVGLLWVAAGACLWGTDTVFRRALAFHVNSVTIVFLEHLILSLVLLPLLWTRRSEWAKLSGRKWIAVIGIAWGGAPWAAGLFTQPPRTANL